MPAYLCIMQKANKIHAWTLLNKFVAVFQLQWTNNAKQQEIQSYVLLWIYALLFPLCYSFDLILRSEVFNKDIT